MYKNFYTILILSSLLLITSCNQQVTNIMTTPEFQTSKTPTILPEATPTITPIPKKAENFEGCSTMDLGTSVEVNNMGYNEPEFEIGDVVYNDSSWIIEVGGVRVEITNSETTNGITHFSINDTGISISEGSIVYIDIHTKNLATYYLSYSPTSNQFLVYYTSSLPPYINIFVDPDSTVSLPLLRREENGYQGNWCMVQEGESTLLFEGSVEDPTTTGKCVTYRFPNGDEYGWGLNKYGEIICPQMWIEEKGAE